MKIAFIGAGSVAFTTNVVKDITTFPALDHAEICLMDINPEHLAAITKCVERIRDTLHSGITITTTLDREEALKGADAVVCTVFNGDVDIWRHEIEIPKKYGVDINVGDTRSVAGIFRALRNIPLLLDICHDMERLCPNAFLLNYTNPMSMLMKAILTYTKVDATGLCHSVQGTSRMLAEWAGADPDRVEYVCLGVNHQAFFTELTCDGQDLYPILREKIKDPVYYKKERVRNEIFKAFGYYVTESSGHNSEYTSWFRKRPDLVRKYSDPDGANWNPGEYAFSLKLREDPHRYENLIADWMAAPVTSERGREYAANIINARLGDGTPFPFNANLLNHGTITNLPWDTCVEIPVVASPSGYARTFEGALPSGPAVLVNLTAGVENLVVEAFEKKSKDLVIQAVAMDPLCSAVLTLEEVRDMCEEIFAKNMDYLGDYT